jgi:hypothetical protein
MPPQPRAASHEDRPSEDRPHEDRYGPLPFFVGVTGHRDLRPGDEELLEGAVRAELRDNKRSRPHSRIVLLSSLAAGADSLAARVALEEGAALWAVLPMPRDDYESDFSPPELEAFNNLMACAEQVLVVPPTPAKYGDERQAAYARAGAWIAARADWMLALWDGTDNQKRGGTADVARFRLEGPPLDLLPPRDPLDAPDTGPLCHIHTPRQSTASTSEAHIDDSPRDKPPPVGSRRVLWARDQNPGEWARARACAEEFNRDVLEADGGADGNAERRRSRSWVLPDEGQKSLRPREREILDAYAAPDSLAVKFAVQTQRTTARLFAWVFVAAACFNLFDALPLSGALASLLGQPDAAEAASTGWDNTAARGLAAIPWLLLASLAAGWLGAGTVHRRASRADIQNKHQDYRALAEGLRVQFFWSLCGLNESASDHYLSKQRGELTWIQNALRFHFEHASLAARSSTSPSTSTGHGGGLDAAGVRVTLKYWIQAQRDYFARKARSEQEALGRDERVITRLLQASGAVALGLCLLLLLEAVTGSQTLNEAKAALSDDWTRTGVMMSIVLLALAAGVLHGFNQQRARAEHAKQFGRMSLIFDTAARRLPLLLESGDEAGARALLFALGREALAENGDWVLLHRERPLEVPRAG